MFIIRLLATDTNTVPFGAMLCGIGIVIAICLVFLAWDLVADVIARRKYKRFRKGYVDLRYYED